MTTPAGDALAEAVARDLLWLCPADRQVDITVCAGQVSVAFGAACPSVRCEG